jgi:1,4-dihydroxy-2-naphthoate octaprenyltransferase
MPSVPTQVKALAQLFRVKPVLSWGVSAIVLGCAIAIGRAGLELNYGYGFLMGVAILVSQGVVSHGLNDAYDWITGTDKESIGKGTGGSRVIPQGKMSVTGVVAAALGGLLLVIGIGGVLYAEYGTPLLVLIAIGVWSPVAYSVPPFKLGYRPFNEVGVVLPALVGAVVAVDLVLVGSWSWAAIGVGYLHALYCISWFVVSRVPDYAPDKRVGKITSVVYVGRDNAKLLSAGYLALALAAVPLLMVNLTPLIGVSALSWALMMVSLSMLDPYDEADASDARLRNMHITTGNALALAIILAVVGV